MARFKVTAELTLEANSAEHAKTRARLFLKDGADKPGREYSVDFKLADTVPAHNIPEAKWRSQTASAWALSLPTIRDNFDRISQRMSDLFNDGVLPEEAAKTITKEFEA